MGAIYSAAWNSDAHTGDIEYFSLVTAATSCAIIRSIRIGQHSDAGDSEAELMRVTIQRFTGTVGSGGAAITPSPHDAGYAAAETTVRGKDTTLSGTLTALLLEETWNLQAGYLYQPTPEELITVSPSTKIAIFSARALDDAADLVGTITFEEIGGA